MPTAYELERAANIARNKALLEELDLNSAVSSVGISSKKRKAPSEHTAKPIQPRRSAVKKEKDEDNEPRRQSARLRSSAPVDPNETKAEKRKREKEIREREAIEAEERLQAEETARIANRPRHHELDYEALAEDLMNPEEIMQMKTCLGTVLEQPYPRPSADRSDYVYDAKRKGEVAKEEAELEDLRRRMKKLRVVSRSKVTKDRIYAAAYHPEVTKDLIFFGDKHGQVGIWDAQAPLDESEDEDDRPKQERPGGKVWRLQPHWPTTSKSSISSIKFNPIDAHSMYTSSYDCTIREMSFTAGISREVYSFDGDLPSSFDLDPAGYVMWLTDSEGWLTHLDMREDKSRARSYQLSKAKIGCVSINPVDTHLLATASNDQHVKIWDARKLRKVAGDTGDEVLDTKMDGPIIHELDDVDEFLSSKKGQDTMRGEWRAKRAVSSAYWDPRGRGIVSTSYDDKIRVWDFAQKVLSTPGALPSMRPLKEISQNTQCGRWVTPLKAQWTTNPDVYPHFTVGNMTGHTLDIFSAKGEPIHKLGDRTKVSAVQAVTASHPNIVERAVSGNASGRATLWAPVDEEEEEAEEEQDED